jgi:hypothetical protein
MLQGNRTIYRISAEISDNDLEKIKAYIKGCVYTFCNTNKLDGGSEWFAAHNLFGDENYYWQQPIKTIWDYHKGLGKSDKVAFNAAGRDIGWLLKEVLNEDLNREYVQSTKQRLFRVKCYRCIQNN